MDEVDSGVDEVSVPESREGSPATKEILPLNNTKNMILDDDDIDETALERLWGLTEMFPPFLRNGSWSLTTTTLSTVKWFYGFSRSALWIFFSSSAILFAPVIFEMERAQLEEVQKQQQRQILLGPTAAVSSGSSHGMGMPMPISPAPMAPPPPSQQPR